MAFNLCTSAAIVFKAGKDCNEGLKTSGAVLAQVSNEAEGFINAMTRYDWVTNYSKVGAQFSGALAAAASSWAAKNLVDYDKSGYLSKATADSKINLLHDETMKIIRQITDDKNKTKMGADDT